MSNIKMDTHDPPHLKLPALKISKKRDRIIVEDDPQVKCLINTRLLLDKKLVDLLFHLLKLTKEIMSLIEENQDIDDFSIKKIQYYSLLKKFQHHSQKNKKKEKTPIITIDREISGFLINNNLITKRRISSLSKKIQIAVNLYEVEKNKNLEVITNRTISFCKQCKRICLQERFRSLTCVCGKKINTPTNCTISNIYRLGNNVISFIENNMWLEHGIDYLLRKKGFNTICGQYILGHSGIMHEVDICAELGQKNLRMLVECKNADVVVNDVFVFAGKMQDIGCTRGYIFATGSSASKEVVFLARSKNITIIEQVLEKNPDKIKEEIKEGPA